ncbi:hypothetical protein [Bacillus sp. UNCCL81]|uniref:hypothetical protein n=1 Tax=Bacillus sp. UNCCL81 TaxID=1502755 RepID=UPI00047255DC|nr:hypothetical protein [Bacillus sp. UNCCL81]SFD61085.1 hypothetical protein SAMN02799633_04276 [Bacillus sp. UNCCL81]
MELTSIFEVVRIKQEIREVSAPFVKYSIKCPEDAQNLAASYITDADREVFLVLMLKTKIWTILLKFLRLMKMKFQRFIVYSAMFGRISMVRRSIYKIKFN